ncbi:TIGR01777 family oxidoreductase [Paradesulfitobacterium aromaticivorans]
MKVAIFGGSGFIGRNFAQELAVNGYQVCVVTRNERKADADDDNKAQKISWHYPEPLAASEELRDADIIVNLAGESIGSRRWTSSVKQEILDSRVNITKAIVSAINDGQLQPQVLINASAVGYYGPCGDAEINENTTAGEDFLAQVCQTWENEAYKVRNSGTRVATLRTGLVLGTEGALNKMLLPFKLYLGGPLGSGKQWFSWIHIKDLTRLIKYIIEHQELSGPVNATAPEPVSMKTFCSTLGEVLERPSWLPVPEFALKAVLGQMSEMLLHGQRAIPQKVLNAGFEFRFPGLKLALEDVLVRTGN